MTYAARHPDLFGYAASFSGAVDSNDPELWPIVQLEAVRDGGGPDSIFGPRATEEANWRGHNPWDLAENLRGLARALFTGNGQKGPYDTTTPFDPIEAGVHDMSVSLDRRLGTLGISHVWNDYGAGQHAWPYWRRDLRQALPDILRTFAADQAPPARFAFTAIENAYDVYGWRVELERPAREFSTLRGAPDGFSLSGSGSAVVITPARYAPGATYDVLVRPDSGAGEQRLHVTADGDGRLKLAVPLGPANPNQQFSVPGRLSGTAVHTTDVTITPPR
jgi:putative esterase